MRFKAGDRVRILDAGDFDHLVGKVRTIVSISDLATFPYILDVPKNSVGGDLLFNDEELELARIKNTKIARKMYPHYEENGEWLIVKEK